jgi:uncharacterized cupin superfamily protein
MAERRHPQVINVADVEAKSMSKGTRFGSARKILAAQVGATGIGASWFEVPPGRTAFPRHFHCANEEALFVLEGEGTLTIGDTQVRVGPGDWVTFPTGPAHAHQLVNSGSTPLRYLGLSTLRQAEVVGYPDSKKIGAMASPSLQAAMKGETWLRIIVRESAGVDYFEGEDTGGQ